MGGIPYEFTDDEVLMVPPSDPDHLAKAIETLLFNPEARSKFLAGYKRRQESRNLRELAADQHARVMLGE